MNEFGLEPVVLKTKNEAAQALRAIGCTEAGVGIMQEKAVFRVICLRHIQTKAANILKQTFLAKGADAAVSKHAADLSEPYTDVLLFANLQQYRRAIRELKRQPWNLPAVAEAIEAFLQEKDG